MAMPVSSGILYILALVGMIIVAWIITSIPIYFAGKLISKKHTTFGKAMLAAIVAPLVTLFFFFVVTAALSLFLGPLAALVGLIIAILVLSYVYASIFKTGLLGGFGIAILATIISYVILIVVAAVFFAALGLSATNLLPGFGAAIP